MSATQPLAPVLSEIRIPVEDYPQFWLGQIKVVADMEKDNVLTRTEMVKEIHRILKKMSEHGERAKGTGYA